MKKILLAVVAVGLLLAGCADGGDGEGGDRAETLREATTTTAAAPTTEPEQVVGDLNARLLTVADMPTGYSEGDPFGDGEEGAEDEEDDSEFCAEAFSTIEDVEPKQEAERAFKKGEPSLFGAAGIEQSLQEMESRQQAEEIFRQIAPVFEKCREFEETDDDGNTFKGTFSPLSFPKLGDDTYALHMSATGGANGFDITIGGDFVFIRKGKVIDLLFAFSFGSSAIPASELEAIARNSVAKL